MKEKTRDRSRDRSKERKERSSKSERDRDRDRERRSRSREDKKHKKSKHRSRSRSKERESKKRKSSPSTTNTEIVANATTTATIISTSVQLPSITNKLTNLISKQQQQPQPQISSPNLINVSSDYTTQILAARAAALAAAKSVNAQILQQQHKDDLKPANSAHHSSSSSNKSKTSSEPLVKKTEAQLLAEKEAEQKRLEEEMRKRRERIEKWRTEKKSKEQQINSVTIQSTTTSIPTNITITSTLTESNTLSLAPPTKKKSWNLEDEDDDEEDENEVPRQEVSETRKIQNEKSVPHADTVNITVQEDEKQSTEIIKIDDNDEEDPLEAYMREITKSSSKTATTETKFSAKNSEKQESENKIVKKVTIMMGIAKSSIINEKSRQKGDIMEQDIDEPEYDSEDDASAQSLNSFIDVDSVNKVKTKAEMVFTDHSKVYYRPFRKNFYVEVPEISQMTQEKVEAYREELEGIKIKGKNCPKPIKTWAQCGVSLKVMECLKRNQFEKPTPIQAQGIPIIMSGRDMIGIAKTGSGKTLAFILPMFRHILDQPQLDVEDGPIAIIMTPTRELAMQIAKECKKFTKYLNLNVVSVYGGSSISEQIAELKRGAEIVVCTPGRMIDMLAANNGRVTNLRRVTYVVLDEADRMFDMGFEPQVNKILDNIRPDKQTVMFSATFPRKMEDLARKAMNKPVEVTIGGRSVVCKDVEQHVIMIDDDTKYLKLLELLGIFQEKGSVIVFVDKQENADELVKNLLKNSYPCMALHGGVDQIDRESIMSFFKQGEMPLLIATSIAARGLDVKDLILVVNYDCPNHYEDYVHRCGRTGRAGNKGFAYTFITPEQKRYAGHIIKALELSSAIVPDELKKSWEDYVKEMEAAGKKVKACTGGFEGKGFKFNEQEEAFSEERKKLMKVAFGLHVDSDEEDADVELDETIEDLFKSKRTLKDASAETSAIATTTGITSITNQQAALASAFLATAQSTAEKLKMAKGIAEKVSANKGTVKSESNVDQLARSILGGTTLSTNVTSKSVAEQIAEKLNMKLNYIKQENQSDQSAEALRVFEEELEINDFPQQARWRITSKETISHICEYAEVGITVRGAYFPPNKEPPLGERRLYLAIESMNEKGLSLAKSEISRIIKEEISKMQNPQAQLVNRGRYKLI
jgi:ATP-dependent RNA helicase DDX46/PRP5